MSTMNVVADRNTRGSALRASRLFVVLALAGGLAACQSADENAISGDKYAAYSETVPDYRILDDEAAMASVSFSDEPTTVAKELQLKVVSYSTAAEEASKCGIFLAEISEWGAINCGKQ